MSFHAPEEFRVKGHSTAADGNNGVFQFTPFKNTLLVVCSDGAGWEHVSVSSQKATPSWEEMCRIKNYFWDDEDTVIQFHPPKSEYVNNHNFCLHMWRQLGKEIERPPSILVGIK